MQLNSIELHTAAASTAGCRWSPTQRGILLSVKEYRRGRGHHSLWDRRSMLKKIGKHTHHAGHRASVYCKGCPGTTQQLRCALTLLSARGITSPATYNTEFCMDQIKLQLLCATAAHMRLVLQCRYKRPELWVLPASSRPTTISLLMRHITTCHLGTKAKRGPT